MFMEVVVQTVVLILIGCVGIFVLKRHVVPWLVDQSRVRRRLREAKLRRKEAELKLEAAKLEAETDRLELKGAGVLDERDRAVSRILDEHAEGGGEPIKR